ncbi:MAG: head GIN domain-containing protein [Chitinophagaceae bacterium]
MKKTALLLLTTVFAITVWAQDKVYNDANAEKRSVSGFHAISVGGGIDLQLTQGNEEAVAVSASKTEYRDKIKTVVENGVLKIFYETDNWRNWGWTGSSKKLKAYVSIKNIDGLKASGGSDVIINGTLNSAKLDLGLSGGSDFKGAVNITELSGDLSGGSDLNISGRATNLTIEASGGSDVDGYELTVDNCTASCSGGSDIRITVNKELVASASGGSDINYRGNATVKKKSSSGGSSVTKRG